MTWNGLGATGVMVASMNLKHIPAAGHLHDAQAIRSSTNAFHRSGNSRNFLRMNGAITRNNAYLKYAQLKK